MHHRALGDEEVYRICVGDDDSTRYYLDRFENFDLGGGPASWNWMAFWASFIWLIHRRTRRSSSWLAQFSLVVPSRSAMSPEPLAQAPFKSKSPRASGWRTLRRGRSRGLMLRRGNCPLIMKPQAWTLPITRARTSGRS